MAVEYLAASRFGLGRRFDDPAIDDPKAWLTRQIGDYDPAPAALAGLAAVWVVLTARSWPKKRSRYDRSTNTKDANPWDVLDAGEDPTAGR